ncbi:sigma-54-dependent transcriptional regulator [Pseudothauera rhizosphaerae]|uniref:Sigma-54-dependent Fis family transcriptional regulator n=1 Tax=Pseudothauera rhizosphaerae TaxID=2565932 RepID=A0A4S4AQL6_9RHOO|nr:response regulator [Pseudothauera rhizosphaerae]THF62024.1 sigma-54-dependent Fis family transcriptional regulator [Pseudothauera rhizosphaerae]
MANILIVDDEMGIRELLSEILRDEGHDVVLAENASAARAARNTARPDLVLLDIWMPDTDGITLLKEWAANGQLSMPVVMMSGHGTIDTAVEATRIGAIDYLEKPIALQKLLAAVKRGLQRPATPGAPVALSLAAFTRSVPLRELRRRIEQIGESSRVLLLKVGGGSIAELAARSVFATSPHWIDLATLHAPIDIGQLQAAHGGVVFAGELARLSRPQQKNLAFVLERLERYDLRMVVATDHGQDSLHREGWDELLLARLFEVSLVPPSLADIRDDLPELAAQILLHLVEAGEVPRHHFSTAALNALRTHPWPGGYAELRAAVKSIALGTLEEEISLNDVRRIIAQPAEASCYGLPLDQPLREAREAFERLYFEHHLRLEGGNMTRLAEKTGLERTHLYRKLKQLGLQAGRRNEEG